ncbi:MAG TPA: hypothetical protein VGG64_09335 [Pirellulales bacterium]|jgi:hypothetical protein
MHDLSQSPVVPAMMAEDPGMSETNGRKRTTLAFGLTAALWLAIVIGGAVILNLHATTPGTQSEGPPRWPDASRIVRNAHGATLLVFVHPHCPCSRTTVGELAALMGACQGRVTAQVLFVVPEAEKSNWSQNELWQAAEAIPGVRAVVDAGAIEAARFGARTSGFTLLFNEQGACLFSGGITAARGHAGDNAGRQAIVSCLIDKHPEVSRTPTFGCALSAAESTGPSEATP